MPRIFLFSAFILFGIFSVAKIGLAQTLKPDILGIQIGMPLDEARQTLKIYDPQLPFEIGTLTLPAVSPEPFPTLLAVIRNLDDAVYATESIQVSISVPPSEPRVWKIFRGLLFEPGNEITKTSLVEKLSEKYGSPNHSQIDSGYAAYYWIYDAEGNLFDPKGAKTCSEYYKENPLYSTGMLNRPREVHEQADFILSQLNWPWVPPPMYQNCRNGSFIGVVGHLTEFQGEMIKQLNTTIADDHLTYEFMEATRALLQNAPQVETEIPENTTEGWDVPQL